MRLIPNNALAERLIFKQTASEGYEKISIAGDMWVRRIKNESRRAAGGGLSHHAMDGTVFLRGMWCKLDNYHGIQGTRSSRVSNLCSGNCGCGQRTNPPSHFLWD